MIFGHFLFVFYLHRSFGKLHPFFTVRFTGFTRPTERMCQLITQPHPPGRPNRTINVFLWCALFNYLWDHYATQITVAPLLSRPKWRLMLYWVSPGQGGGGMHGEIFFPLPSLDFSIGFAVKANCRRITFLHMEKGPLPRMEGLSSLET